jgi:hypothetical protein
MKETWKPFILLMGVLLAASCSSSLTEAEMTATQEALASPTPTATHTPTALPTATPTITQTPTATPVPFEVEIQDDGSSLIRVPAYGFQFVLPGDWSYGPPDADANPGTFGTAEFPIADGSNGWLRLAIVDTQLSPEAHMEEWIEHDINALAATIHRQGVTTNGYNIPIAFFEESWDFHTEHAHLYNFYFISNGEMISFFFGSDINLVIPAIEEIQASIQGID